MVRKSDFIVTDHEGEEIRERDKVAFVSKDGCLESGFVDLILAKWCETDKDLWPAVEVQNIKWKNWKDVIELERFPDEMWVVVDLYGKSVKVKARECAVVWRRI